ncbi:cadmium resistance transporter [Nostoc sp. CMAA1605]|uniref:cadmium resistance transporter n=1 Tax=Nostoc sp. CMAA1605 TaxID=2055159 RepID=UPI001F474CB0|nr:cadmium resistance transporter [Nostoc sp. CMAA1605]MCF4969327.1 transporter [Nostoc sp. CMAA1605]
MGSVVKAIVSGIVSFAATNLDDIIILMVFFSQVNANFRRRHIIIGQYLGFSAVILASLPGFFGGLIIPAAWIGLLGFIPIVIGISRLINLNRDENEVQTVSEELNSSPGRFAGVLAPQTYQVAVVTFANGGDNIGIYVPLFASSNLLSLSIILSVFVILVSVWCYVAYQLTLHPVIARFLTRYGHAIVPFILIGLGIYILIDSGSYRLINIDF